VNKAIIKVMELPMMAEAMDVSFSKTFSVVM
jgi:hypothetical protein